MEIIEDDDDDEYAEPRSIAPTAVDIGETLAEGHFAVVSIGSISCGNRSRPVAVKMLKRKTIAVNDRPINECAYFTNVPTKL